MLLGVKKRVIKLAEASKPKASAIAFLKVTNFTKKSISKILKFIICNFTEIIHHLLNKIKGVE